MQCEKYESTGNDFLLMRTSDLEGESVSFTPESLSDLARRMCHRHFGIGADGILVLDDPGKERDGFNSYETISDAHCRMYLVNADGSPAEMSGNGIRCFAAFAASHGYGDRQGDKTRVVVETRAGIKDIILRSDDNGMIGDVDMGMVSFEPYQIPFTGDDPMKVPVMLLGKERIGVAANSGVPHLVITLDSRDELEDEALSHEALVLRYDDRFPDNTNVSVIVIESRNKVSARIFERGAHETLSCGTAATAIAAILQKQGDIANEVAVSLRGGELFVHLDHSAILSGPVNKISSCDYAL